jgi:transcriptional regulator with XRE-family HTH domain
VAYSSSVPEVRLQFAKRLKELRTEKGFRHARAVAQALGIEENRYTRYERAEVEPSLTMILGICQILRVSPNQLLAPADEGRDTTIGKAVAPGVEPPG